MGRDKHEPKDSKQKFQISDDAEKTLIGLMLVIISLIGLFNRGFVGEFLTYIFGGRTGYPADPPAADCHRRTGTGNCPCAPAG